MADADQEIAAPSRPTSVILTPDDLNLLRQWYNAMCDAAPGYAEETDHRLAERLGFRANRPRPR